MTDLEADIRQKASKVGRECALFVGVFVVASFLGALVWDASVNLPRWQVSSDGIAMGPVSATKTIGIDAVYLFIALPTALLLGAGLMWWRRNSPTLTVVLVAICGILAAALMERFGLWFGPGDPARALVTAAKGVTAPVRLQVQATGVLLAWPAAAVLGALLVLLFAPSTRFAPADGSDLDTVEPQPVN